MINLLPKEDKKTLLVEKNKKITVILCFLLLFFIICLILILFSIKTYISGRIDAKNIFLAESEKQLFQSETRELEDKIKMANNSFGRLDSFYSKNIYFSEVLEKVSAIFPEYFYVTNLSMKLDIKEVNDGLNNPESIIKTERSVSVSLSGFAPTREELRLFKENLEKSFENILFPYSNWLDKENINFYVTFNIGI